MPVVYCGPNLPKMGIRKFQVFEHPDYFILKQAVEKIPEIEKLLVPYQELSSTREKINTKGTPENLYYATIEGKL